MSSEERKFELMLAEKFLGIILLIVGALFTYYTLTSVKALEGFTGFFGGLSFTFLLIGIILIIAKTR